MALGDPVITVKDLILRYFSAGLTHGIFKAAQSLMRVGKLIHAGNESYIVSLAQ